MRKFLFFVLLLGVVSLAVRGQNTALTGITNNIVSQGSRGITADKMNTTLVGIVNWVGSPSLKRLTIVQTRALTTDWPNLVQITDGGSAGFFSLDATDNTTADNGGTVIVTTSGGKRYKRVSEVIGTVTGLQAALDLKAPLASPTFTGTVTMPTISANGASISNVELSYVDGVTSSIQTQLGTKAPLASPTFTGTVVLPSTTSIGTISNTELSYVDGVTSGIQTQLNALPLNYAKLATINYMRGLNTFYSGVSLADSNGSYNRRYNFGVVDKVMSIDYDPGSGGSTPGILSFDGNTSAANFAFKLSTNASFTADGQGSIQNIRIWRNTNTSQSIGIGFGALQGLTNGQRNTALGDSASRLNTTGAQNTVIGYRAMENNTTGGFNVAIGGNAGRNAADGLTNNTYIHYSGVGASTNNNVWIGDGSAVRIRANSTGDVGINTGTNTLLATGGGLDIASGLYGLVIGANTGSSSGTRTNSNNKYASIGSMSYTNAEEPLGMLIGTSTSTSAVVSVGGSSIHNAPTKFSVFTAANNTTLSGTERLRVDSIGNVGIGVVPIQKLTVQGVNGLPNTSGTASDGIMRLQPTGTALTVDFGASTSPSPHGWIQPRANTSYATNYNLVLNPNGGNVAIGSTLAPAKLTISAPSGSAIIALQRTPFVASSSISGIGFMNSAGNYNAAITATYGADSLAGASIIFRSGTANSSVYSVSEAMRVQGGTGNIGIGGAPASNAILDVQSTTKGLLIPRMTTTQRNAISSPGTSLLVFDTDLVKYNFYNGTAWEQMVSYKNIVTTTYDAPNLVSLGVASTTVTVTGAALGDRISATINIDQQGIIIQGYVSATNTVTLVFMNTGSVGAVDLASATVTVRRE